MGEDRYRLAPVRDARERNERIRKGELATAVGDAKQTEAAHIRARDRVDAARGAVAAAIAARPQDAAAVRLAASERFVARRRRELAEALLELEHAEAAHAERAGVVDAARGTLARARAEREVIERHFARWRDERRKLADRRED